jgi:hypothetical protein
MKACICPFERCISSGPQTGDFDSDFLGSDCFLMTCFHSGSFPLNELEAEFANHSNRMREFKQTFNLGLVSPLFQQLLCLLGKAKYCTRLRGAACDGEAMHQAAEKDNNVIMLHVILFTQLYLSCYFGDCFALKHLLAGWNETY